MRLRFFKSQTLLCYICFLGLLSITSSIFAAVPIQGNNLRGAAAAEARFKLLSAAESYLGTPYRYAGLDRKGLDCSGLVYLSFREGLNHKVPRTVETIYAWAEKIATSDLQPGDLVFFVTTGSSVSHVGIYAGKNRFIHSASEGPRTGVIYSRLDESYWKRSYKGAGRALPWDEETALAMASQSGSAALVAGGSNPAGTYPEANQVNTSAKTWNDTGFYAGFGAGWTWGGFIDGSPSLFRGISALATAGYKWSSYMAGIEMRPAWDRALGVFRLPFTLTFGTDIFKVFVGPAYTFGEPELELNNGDRSYKGGGTWLWEAGLSGALPPVRLGPGALSFFGELAWQPYHWQDGKDFSFKPDITANIRLSTGVRYLWHL